MWNGITETSCTDASLGSSNRKSKGEVKMRGRKKLTVSGAHLGMKHHGKKHGGKKRHGKKK
jgi:hypothetical protein